MMHGFGGFGSFGTFGWLGMLLNLIITVGLIVGVVLLVVWAVRRFSPSEISHRYANDQAAGESSPKEILKARYARGEIDRDQYLQMLQDMGHAG